MYLFRRMDSSASMGHLPGRMGLENGWLISALVVGFVCIQLHEIRACALHVRQNAATVAHCTRTAPAAPCLLAHGVPPDAAGPFIISDAVTPRPLDWAVPALPPLFTSWCSLHGPGPAEDGCGNSADKPDDLTLDIYPRKMHKRFWSSRIICSDLPTTGNDTPSGAQQRAP